jgi:hypothetical protein
MDLELQVDELLLPPYTEATEVYEIIAEGDAAPYQVRFRLPTGADQEACAAWARSDPNAAADLLLRRCLQRVITNDAEPVENVPPVVAQQLPALMAKLDPQAELVLNLRCPGCDHTFSALLDMGTYFVQELADRAQWLYHDTHLLALYYHWTHADIMAMPTRARRRQVEALIGALGERGQQ